MREKKKRKKETDRHHRSSGRRDFDWKRAHQRISWTGDSKTAEGP
jgi:hypothetical protein